MKQVPLLLLFLFLFAACGAVEGKAEILSFSSSWTDGTNSGRSCLRTHATEYDRLAKTLRSSDFCIGTTEDSNATTANLTDEAASTINQALDALELARLNPFYGAVGSAASSDGVTLTLLLKTADSEKTISIDATGEDELPGALRYFWRKSLYSNYP